MASPRADGEQSFSVSRGTRAIQAMVEHAPSTGGLALWMKHVDVADDALLPAPVANDGNTVFYAPRFAALPFDEQIGWVAHETLHVAFRHVQRREQLAGVLGDVDETLFNACADALVNSALSHLSWLQLPKGSVYLDVLMRRLFDDKQAVESLLLQWDVERLYGAVDDRQASRSNGRQSVDRNSAMSAARSQTARATGERGAGSAQQGRRDSAARSSEASPDAPSSGAGGGEQGGEQGDEKGGEQRGHEGALDGPRSASVRALAARSERDLLAGTAAERPEDAVAATRQWAERLARSHAADGAFSLLRTLSADSPRVRTPWAQVLRRSLARGLLREPELSWSRPSRSWLANRGRTRGGRRMPWEPGVVTSKSVPRLALILDVSGSIDDALLARFAGQLDAITRQLEAQIVLIAGDDQVRYQAMQAPGRCGVLALPDMAGGGGTDFAPLLEAAAGYAPDYAVVLTDLRGPAGLTPRFPVLWAVPPASAYLTPPFGRLLVLAD